MNFDDNGVAGGVFSFSLNDIINNNNGTANGGGNNTPQMQFSSLTDVLNNATTNNTANNISNVINSIFQSINAPNNVIRRVPDSFLNSLNPLLKNQIPQNESSNSNDSCPICYDPYVFPDDDNQISNQIEEIPSSISNSTNELIPGYHTDDDPFISFPAIETATYQHSYTPSIEQEFQPTQQSSNSPDVESHYAVMLPECGHVFGKPCIVEWLHSNTSCPLCRREVIPETSQESESSNVNSNSNNNVDTNTNTTQRTFVYNQAITETYIPVDWTAPFSAGYILSDPPLTMPVPGIGISSGRRTGRDP